MGAYKLRNVLVLLWWMTQSVYAVHNGSLAWNISSSSILSTTSVDRTYDSVLLLTSMIPKTSQQPEALIYSDRTASVESTTSTSDGNSHSRFIEESSSTNDTPPLYTERNASLAKLGSFQTTPVSWTRPPSDNGSRTTNSTLDYVLQTTEPRLSPSTGIQSGKSSLPDTFNSTSNITQSQIWARINNTLKASATKTLLFGNSTVSNTTCPTTSYAPDYPYKILHLSGCEYQTRYFTDVFYYNYENRCLASYCKTSWFSAIDAYTGPIPTITTKIPYMSVDWDEQGVPTSFGPLTTLTISCK